MAEYKDITKLTKEIADFKKSINSPNSDYLTGYLSALSVTEGIIANIPTEDVVKVVRCSNCVKYEPDIIADGVGWCNKFECGMYDNDFCSFGKLKDGENDA